MTGVLLAAGASDDPISAAVREAPIELRLDDSLKVLAAPIRNVPAAMIGVLIGSLVVHALLLATAVISGRTDVVAPSQEIAVDIVQDAPKPVVPPKPAGKPPARPEAKTQVAKLEPPKLSPPKPESAESDPAKPVLAAAKPEVAKQLPPPAPKPQPQAAKPPTQPAKPEVAAKSPADAKEIEALEKELSDLRAQQAALKSVPQDPVAGGPLAGSLQAIAMPSIGPDGETVGYQELVFSQLAKAKGDEEYHGQAGTTGVRFEVDVQGRLLGVEVAASSGNPALDKEALDIVHRAAPFPPPPKDADHTFFANVNFRPPKA